ncbi:hypothetical protein E2C01_087035 [Portunus trituberculatus]|uniref:Uncharacterized protein n=1 Tax=Portunus trituberculatus TaxID=210409 RepID=A0A5B7JG79_PORTR|nr:hypothetical protein [Portunus trituberculatus]
MVQWAGTTFASPPAPPKLKIGDPPVPLKTQGSRKLLPASITRVGKPLWCLGTQGACTVGSPSRTGSGSWQEAHPHLEPQPRPLPLSLLVAVDIFTGRCCKPHLNQLSQSWAGTLVSLREKTWLPKKGQKGRHGQQKQKGTAQEDIEGTHPSLG